MSSVSLNKYWFFYFTAKLMYLFLAKLFVSGFTQLGDTARYISGRNAWRSDWFYSSTTMMDSFASLSGKVFGPNLASMPFLLLSFLGVYYPIAKMKLSRKQLTFILVMLSLPSFGIWTSIASKEAVSVFCLGVILCAYIDLYEYRPINNKFLLSIAVYLLLVFKPQYFIGILYLFTFLWLGRRFRSQGGVEVLFFVVAIAVGVVTLYVFRDIIDGLSKAMPAHFSKEAGSTRENTIWLDQYDFFKNAAYGMYIGFVGPTVLEALSKPTHMVVWLESIIILSFFSYLSLKYLMFVVRTSKVNVMFLCGFALCVFWILLVHYPFGVLNPGSAVRYRQSFYAFFVCLFFFLYLSSLRNRCRYRDIDLIRDQ